MPANRKALPATGQDWDELKSNIAAMRQHDVDWRHGRAAVYVFYAGDDGKWSGQKRRTGDAITPYKG